MARGVEPPPCLAAMLGRKLDGLLAICSAPRRRSLTLGVAGKDKKRAWLLRATPQPGIDSAAAGPARPHDKPQLQGSAAFSAHLAPQSAKAQEITSSHRLI